ncbi:MAG TPA: STAS domain-containing protein [Bryobacteraceae bacterium]|nr:STAS domain-containing protein [Bryobacteraceae bacterium]
MGTIAVMFKIDGEGVAPALQQAGERLDKANGQAVLDFSTVRRVDPAGLCAMEELAGIADGRGVKLALRGVNIEVYKVLKLAKLTPRFSFLS